MLNIAVCVSGGGTNLQAIIDSIKDQRITNARIIGVFSNNPGAYALKRAQDAEIDTLCIRPSDFKDRSGFNDAFLKAMDSWAPDLIVLAGFLVIIPEDLVRKYEGRIINIHPSLIPSFCGKDHYGLKVHEEALARGVKVTGATVHFVDEGTDTGRIIAQKAVSVKDGDTPEVLQKRVMEEAEWVLLPQVIDDIANGRLKY